MNLIDRAFEKAQETLRMCSTERGFTACAVDHDHDPQSNYRSVWSRDSAMTGTWSLPLRDPELTEMTRRSLETLLENQTRDGHLPNYVDVVTGEPEFGGIGNIAGIDSALWVVIASWNYIRFTDDRDFLTRHYKRLHRTMKWLKAHDSNNCGLLEIPEASDWTDLFGRSYNVLYDEVLWYRATADFVRLRERAAKPMDRYVRRAKRIRKLINQNFWPTAKSLGRFGGRNFGQTQFTLGTTKYLIAQITPFDYSWRCDVLGNLIAYLYGVLDEDRARSVYEFLVRVGADKPFPVRCLYPAVQPGDPDFRNYFLVHLHNLPHHYHNGGIWPFIGGLWVRFLVRLGERERAEGALRGLAEVCRKGFDREWEFTEWAHGQSGEPMGKPFQAWSAASYVAAYLALQGDRSLEEDQDYALELPSTPAEVGET